MNKQVKDMYTKTDKYGESVNIAILERHKIDGTIEYIVAWDYDFKTGTWKQGHYDFKDRAEAQKYTLNRYEGVKYTEKHPI